MFEHTQEIAARERQIKRDMIPFGLAIIAAVVIWLAFTYYL